MEVCVCVCVWGGGGGGGGGGGRCDICLSVEISEVTLQFLSYELLVHVHVVRVELSTNCW